MADPLVRIFRFLQQRRFVSLVVLVILLLVIGYSASRIRFEENISGSVNRNGSTDPYVDALNRMKLADRLTFMISWKDTVKRPDPGLMVQIGERFIDSLLNRLDTGLIRDISFRASDSSVAAMLDLAERHLPVFLDSADYIRIDSLLSPDSVDAALAKDYRILLSPASVVLKQRIRKDPLGISSIALEKLRSLGAGGAYRVIDGYIFSSDSSTLLFFVTPELPSSRTDRNQVLIGAIDRQIESMESAAGPSLTISYFGGTAVAVCNARQIKKDIALTLIIAGSLIFLLLGWYFRSLRVPLLGLLPALFGGSVALVVLSVTKGTISAISLGIGSVILGLIVDYALYLINNYRQKRDITAAIREMSLPILLCSLTSAGAFLCLTRLDSTVLQDLGWFAALSVAGASLFTLIVLPHLVGNSSNFKAAGSPNIVDKVAGYRFDRNVWLVAGILAVSVAAAFFAARAGFETNMSSFSYMTPALREAEAELDKLTGQHLKKVYVIAKGNTPEKALRRQEQDAGGLKKLVDEGIIHSIAGAGPLLLSDSLQQLRIDRWNRFWTPARRSALSRNVEAAAARAGFRAGAFGEFLGLPRRTFLPMPLPGRDTQSGPLTRDWLHIGPDLSLSAVILNVTAENKDRVYRAVASDENFLVFDRQLMTERFVDGVRHDFDLLVKLSMGFVTLLLIFSFGRIGLGLIAALPMFLAWLITLGFMGITGLRFNIFNIIVSSFVFGLGVDYSILMMRGLQQALIDGRDEIKVYKVSVLLSALTTIFGVGALFLARHPALNSIALISTVGIITVVMISFTLQPLIFNRLFLERARIGKFPVTFRIVVKTFVTWGNIVLIAIVLMVLGSLINLILPVPRKKKEKLFHWLFSRLSRAYIAFTFPWRRRLINPGAEDFSRPAIIISNHQSLIETPAFLRLYPKIIILTTRWVYRSPVFGPIARLANFFDIDEGIENLIDRMKEKTDEGYSVLIFPEGHRSDDHRIGRFHRGAFFLAEKLQMDILPIVVFGSGDFLHKGDFWGKPNYLRMKVLPRITSTDDRFGKNYGERTRNFRQFYIREYDRIRLEEGTPDYYRRVLALNYVLKGPVLEWYMRIKIRLEDNYRLYDQLLPREGKILDLGCGYGFLAYMLMLTSDRRVVTGVDYDVEKTGLAASNFSRNDRIRFVTADVSEYAITPHKGFVLSDVLHYLDPLQQASLLRRCCHNLEYGGAILVREANAELEKRHRRSKLTELFSTRSGFNKTAGDRRELHFTSAARIKEIAAEEGLTMETYDTKHITSNNLFVLRKGQDAAPGLIN